MQPLKKREPAIATKQIAAVDLGSNSFHMVIARMHGAEIQLIDRLREQVRLADGFDEQRRIGVDAQARALDCLRRFGQRLGGLPPENVRVVGTNTLRSARNAPAFIERAEEALGHPIEVVSGIEEARLIYSGVVHSIGQDADINRLVIDIGGGSTELIIGRGVRPLLMESLYIGSVTLTNRFFRSGKIAQAAVSRALLEVQLELEPKLSAYRERGWNSAIGTSGTAIAVHKILEANGWSRNGITPAGARRLLDAMLEAGDTDALKLEGLSRERARILPAGLIILIGAIEALGIDRLEVSDGALREGLLYDLVGRQDRNRDARGTSVKALAGRYHVDEQQARRVEDTAAACLRRVAEAWKLDEAEDGLWLRWAARLHEIGLDIAHSNYQKHGAYVIGHADLAGFSYQEQQLLALLVLAHRRKFPVKALKAVRSVWGKKAERLALLLRLSALLHRSRSAAALPEFALEGRKKWLSLRLPPGWLEAHPLTRADLTREAEYLEQIDVRLEFE